MDGHGFDALARQLGSGRSRRSVLRGLVGGGTAVVATKAGVSLAAPEDKVAICHWSEELGAFEPISVSGNALQAHLAHGDEVCEDGEACGASGCDQAGQCQNLGWKTGGDDWSCPVGMRMPTTSEWALIEPCVTAEDENTFYNDGDTFRDVAVSVGGCNCVWNPDWCELPSIETIRYGRACGDFAQLHICVSV